MQMLGKYQLCLWKTDQMRILVIIDKNKNDRKESWWISEIELIEMVMLLRLHVGFST